MCSVSVVTVVFIFTRWSVLVHEGDASLQNTKIQPYLSYSTALGNIVVQRFFYFLQVRFECKVSPCSH